jgi:hypothetical protein
MKSVQGCSGKELQGATGLQETQALLSPQSLSAWKEAEELAGSKDENPISKRMLVEISVDEIWMKWMELGQLMNASSLDGVLNMMNKGCVHTVALPFALKKYL